MTRLDDVRFVIDENLLRMSKGVVPVRRDTAVFSSPPVEELLPSGILDTEWIPVVGERGWVVITSDRRLRTRPAEASLARFYGADGAELMRRISVEPDLDDIAADTDEPPEVAAVAYSADGLAALLAERPACWRYAVFVSVLVQRRATLQPRLRDQQLGYAPPGGVRIHTGVELGRFMIDLLEQMVALVGQIEQLMLSSAFTRMFGDPRAEGSADADAIVHAANRLMDLHERLLSLAERCRAVVAPSQHADVVRDCARVLDVPLEGYRRFIDEFVARVGELPEVLRYARGTVEVDPVMLEMDDSDELRRKAFAGIEKLAPGAR